MDDVIVLESPVGLLRLRPETGADEGFRFRLFCASQAPELSACLPDPVLRDQLMLHQFRGQTMTYAAQFPDARSDIVELDGVRIGRIVVDRPGDHIRIVDQAIVPEMRGRGIGTTIMGALMAEAAAAGVPVRLMALASNSRAVGLYLRLGFMADEEIAPYLALAWRPGPGAGNSKR